MHLGGEVLVGEELQQGRAVRERSVRQADLDVVHRVWDSQDFGVVTRSFLLPLEEAFAMVTKGHFVKIKRSMPLDLCKEACILL